MLRSSKPIQIELDVCTWVCYFLFVCFFAFLLWFVVFLFKTEKEHEVGFEEYLEELVEGEMKKSS